MKCLTRGFMPQAIWRIALAFAFLPAGEFLADLGRQAVVMGRFDQEQARVPVAAFGDRALPAACPVLRSLVTSPR